MPIAGCQPNSKWGLDSENSNQINMVSTKLHLNFIELDIMNKWMAPSTT